MERGKRAHVLVCGSVSRIRSLEKKEAETLLDQNCKRSLTESFIKSLAELTSRNPWLPTLLYSTGVNSFTERHLKHLTLSLLAWSSSFSGQTNQKRSLSHLQKEDPNLPCVDRQLNLTVLHVPSVFWGKRVRNGGEGSGRYFFIWFFYWSFVLQQLDRKENEDTEAAGSVVSLRSSVNSVALVIQLPSAP